MAKIIGVDGYEVEAGFIVQHGAFHATVMVRTKVVTGRVREIGYVFAEAFNTESAAMNAAQQYTIASLDASRLIRAADGDFACSSGPPSVASRLFLFWKFNLQVAADGID